MFRKDRVYLAGLAAALLLAAPAGASIISVNLGSGQTGGSLDATESAGLVPAVNWNNVANLGSTVTDLNDDSGTPTTADISGTIMDGSLATSETDTDPDSKMMKGFNGKNNTTPHTVTVSDVPTAFTTAGYYVLAYWGGPPTNRSGTWKLGLTVGSDTYWLDHADEAQYNDPPGYVQATSTDSASPTLNANYAQFGSASAPKTASSFTLTLTVTDQRMGLSGLQIVQVPEPATLGLMALGGAGLVLLRRKRR